MSVILKPQQHLTTTLNIIKSSGESFNKKIAKSLKNSQKERIHDDNDVDDDIFFDALNTCGDEGILIPIRKQEMTEASLRYSVQSLTDARSINIFSHAKKVDLQQSLIEAMSIMKLVFENRLNEALKYSKNNESKSIYHSLCHSGLRFMQAIMSFQMDDIETTNQAIKQTITLTKKIIEKSWFSESNASLEISTGYELHARLVYAEVLLLHSLLVFLQDQNLFSFIRGGMKMKECNDVFKKLTKYSQIDNTNEYNTKIFSSKQIYEHFDSGVRMGIGVFNIITSTLPERITKYLSLVGFSGKTDVGLIELKKSAISNGLRAPLSALFLLTYYLFIQQIYVNSEGNLDQASLLLNKYLKIYPHSCIFLFFRARIELLLCNLNEAVIIYQKTISIQNDWKHLHHISQWEMMWCYVLQYNWKDASRISHILLNESNWSKAIFCYYAAVFKYELYQDHVKEELLKLFKRVPELKIRIAGKSIPMEKYAIKKCEHFLTQKWLLLPGYELIYMWNGFYILRKNRDKLLNTLETINNSLNEIKQKYSHDKFYIDNLGTGLLLKGVIKGFLLNYDEAHECFNNVIQMSKQYESKSYLTPNAYMEKGFLFIYTQQFQKAKDCLNKAVNDYIDYQLESRLHFKVNAALRHIKMLESQT